MQLLTMSVSIAERFLQTQRKPPPRGLSTTKAGALYKPQIPFRPFHAWEENTPGFLEVDLVAYCGGNIERNYLYTLNLMGLLYCTKCLGPCFFSFYLFYCKTTGR